MKRLYLLIFLLLPLGLSLGAQHSLITESDSLKSGEVNNDFEFHHWAINNDSSGALNLRWRLFESFAGVENWEDNICEGVLICFPATTRFNDFTVAAGDSFELLHHIVAKDLPGYGSSTLCVFDTADSAGTVACLTVYADAIMPDTLQIYVDGTVAYVIDGDTFEIYEGAYVPLTVNEFYISTPALGQNKPNPFKNTTTIDYAFNGTKGELLVHDLTGKLITSFSLLNNVGKLEVGGELNAGIYFYSLYADGQRIDTKRMQVID